MYVIFIGPKKTATTAVYNSLKKHKTAIKLLPKETNLLTKKPILMESKDKLIIDVSPQYFASYSAIFNVYRMVKSGINVKVVVLRREEKKRLNSHISYMMKKKEITPLSIGYEFDTICLQNDTQRFTKLWKRVASSYNEFSIQDDAFTQFLSSLVGMEINELLSANDGNFAPRFGINLAKKVAKILRFFRLHAAVEKIANSPVKFIFYKSGERRDPQELKFEEEIKNFIKCEIRHEN